MISFQLSRISLLLNRRFWKILIVLEDNLLFGINLLLNVLDSFHYTIPLVVEDI